MPASSEPVIWQFSLSSFNAIVWVAMLLFALLIGLRMRWGRLVAVTAFLTLDLIAFGAFVRLTDSGLGCPDWPGCYGQLLPVQANAQINQAISEQGGTHGPVSHGKAWIEMLHRYLASFIGVLILLMCVRAVQTKFATPRAGVTSVAGPGLRWPFLLLLVVSAQGLFGKWTVTLKLMPIVVTLHLMGGMLLFALLFWFWMRERSREDPTQSVAVPTTLRTRVFIWLAILTVAVQIFLGGWVSTNYAVLACPDFPDCNRALASTFSWADGFTLDRALGRNADGSFLSIDGLRAIHWAHRVGALLTTIVVLASVLVMLRANKALTRQATIILLMLGMQVAIGIGTVVFGQPIVLATAHNFFAAVLLASLLAAAFRLHHTN